MNGFIYRGSMTFLPTLIKEQVHVNVLGINQAALAGSLTTFALLTGGIGQYLGGRLSDRVPLERLALQITIIVVPALLLVGIGGGMLVVVAATAFIFFNFSGQPVFNSLLAEYVPGSALGRGYGLSFFASFGLGSVAAGFSGFLADRWGTSSVFLGLAAFSLLTVAFVAMLWRLSTRGALPRPVREAVSPLAADDCRRWKNVAETFQSAASTRRGLRLNLGDEADRFPVDPAEDRLADARDGPRVRLRLRLVSRAGH